MRINPTVLWNARFVVANAGTPKTIHNTTSTVSAIVYNFSIL
jgi:hypothetical protein